MMKHLIVYSHPNPKSFNHAILKAYQEAAQERKDEVRVRDLYHLGFQPVLAGNELAGLSRNEIASDILEEHQHVAWADILTFIFPLWWGGMPAIAKGYVDRVFCDGFAYRFSSNGLEQLLKTKKVLTITTLGDSNENYEKQGFFDAMDKLMDGITYTFSGLQSVGHVYFGSVVTVTQEVREAMLQTVREKVQSL